MRPHGSVPRTVSRGDSRPLLSRIASAVRGARLAARGGRIGRRVVFRSGAQVCCDDLEIGDDCHVGEDVLIRARRVTLGAGTHIAARTSIVADEIDVGRHCVVFEDVAIMALGRFGLGAYGKIGRRATLRARSIDIGMEFWMNSSAEIGGGGWRSGAGRFRAGDRCHVGRATHVNVAEPVVLGEDTAIGMDCTLATHAHWQPVLEGYPSRRGPIRLGNNVAIYTRSLIAPGVTIGDGATVASASVVLDDVPPHMFAAGVPATVRRPATTGAAAGPLALEILHAFVAAQGLTTATRGDDGFTATRPSGEGTLVYPGEGVSPDPALCRDAVVVVFGRPARARHLECRCLVDLDRRELHGRACELTEALRMFLFSHGIRFRYSGGYRRQPLGYSRLIELGLE
jgi:acetyltransferase-like isoleucine patch superfamily enzyme